MEIKLNKAINHNGKNITELDLNLEELTGNDLLAAEDELKRKGLNVAAWEYSRDFLITVAAKSLKLPVEAMKALSARDFTRVVNEVLAFLAGTDSQIATAENSAK